MDNLLQKHLKRSAIQTEVQKLSKYPTNIFRCTRCLNKWSLDVLKALDEPLQKRPTPAGLNYKELGGLSDLGQQDCSLGRNILE